MCGFDIGEVDINYLVELCIVPNVQFAGLFLNREEPLLLKTLSRTSRNTLWKA